MLQKTSKETQRLLELADFLDGLNDDQFDIGTWGGRCEPRCICGWFQHLHAFPDKDDWVNAAEMLGIDQDIAHRLFTYRTLDRQRAVKVLRHLAVTGELVP